MDGVKRRLRDMRNMVIRYVAIGDNPYDRDWRKCYEKI